MEILHSNQNQHFRSKYLSLSNLRPDTCYYFNIPFMFSKQLGVNSGAHVKEDHQFISVLILSK
jgi:hypothetical protein